LLGHAAGWPSPQGGAGNLARALVGYLHALGGQTRTSSPVTQLLTRRRRVTGALLADGTLIRADTIIADVMPHSLLHLAGEALPAGYANRLRHYRYGPPSLKIDWALSASIPWEAPAARQAGTVHVGGEADDIWQVQNQQRAGIIPERPFLLLGQQSLADPTRAPAGNHTAWAYTHPPAAPPIDWTHETGAYVERIEEHIEQYAPGFRSRILARHVLTPPDMEQQNRNLVGGDVGGGSYALDQLIFRPVPSLTPYRTPVRGLYIGSAATFPGAAVHGAGGQAAARLALLEAQVRR
jgi:phytoene dehydrogenase-like protein